MMRQYSVGVNAARGVLNTLIFGNSGNFCSWPCLNANDSTLRTATRYWLTVVVEYRVLMNCANASNWL